MWIPYGLHCAQVQVATETGGVDIVRCTVAYDVSLEGNPQLGEGQIVGDAVEGVGGAPLEELAYDPQGQLVAGSFIHHLLPTVCEAPHVELLLTEDAPTPHGAKGAGEGEGQPSAHRVPPRSPMRWVRKRRRCR